MANEINNNYKKQPTTNFQSFISSPMVINEATDYDDLFGIEI